MRSTTTFLHEQLDIIDKQSTIIFGTIGHVAHGKTTLVKQLTGIQTNQHSKEKKLGITIKLGYANCKIFECDNLNCSQRYETLSQFRDNFPQQSEQVLKQLYGRPVHRYDCPHCLEGTKNLKRHISFVDCPGHEAFILTMLNGAAVMDNALLLVSAARQDYNSSVEFPMPQTLEHLVAADLLLSRRESSEASSVIVLQNKLDVCDNKQVAMKQYRDILDLCQTFECTRHSQVIPIIAQQGFNIDKLLEEIVQMPLPKRDVTSSLRMPLIRSFNLNKPGCEIDDLQGGVLGGNISHGIIAKGDLIELRPGIIEVISTNEKDKKFVCRPIITRVQMLFCENDSLEKAYPGGLIAVGTNIDPTLCKDDRLVGQVLVLKDDPSKPPIVNQLHIQYELLDRGRISNQDEKESHQLLPLSRGESIFVTAGSKSCVAKIVKLNTEKREALIILDIPICIQIGDIISFSRRGRNMFIKDSRIQEQQQKEKKNQVSEMRWRLAGYATINEGSLHNATVSYK